MQSTTTIDELTFSSQFDSGNLEQITKGKSTSNKQQTSKQHKTTNHQLEKLVKSIGQSNTESMNRV
jgi:hypothetical protein